MTALPGRLLDLGGGAGLPLTDRGGRVVETEGRCGDALKGGDLARLGAGAATGMGAEAGAVGMADMGVRTPWGRDAERAGAGTGGGVYEEDCVVLYVNEDVEEDGVYDEGISGSDVTPTSGERLFVGVVVGVRIESCFGI